MQPNTKSLDFGGQDIFAGIDVHLNSWTVTILTANFEHKTFSQPADPRVLIDYLKKNFPSAHYHTAYEAGYCGFGIHEEFKKNGIDSIVVNPVDIPTSNKEKKNKTDIRDSRKIARCLRNGELTAIYVPSPDDLQDRILLRTRRALISKQTRCKNQIKSFLAFYGIKLPDKQGEIKCWSGNFILWLKKIQFKQSAAVDSLSFLIDELLYLKKLVAQATIKIRKLSQTPRFRDNISIIRSIPGISLISGMTFLTEIIDINRFKKITYLDSFVGLVPGEHSSGNQKITTEMTSRGNSYLKFILIESAWVAVKKDPALLMAYNELTKRMKKTEAIIRIAKKLLNRIRFVLKNKTPYVIAVIK